MNDQDSAEFDLVLSRLFRTMGKPVPDADVKRVWWGIFKKFDLQEFAQACADYMRNEDRFPVPAAVKRYVPRRTGSQKLLVHDPRNRRFGKMKKAEILLRECRRNLEKRRGNGEKFTQN